MDENKTAEAEVIEAVVEKTPEQLAFEAEEAERLRKVKWANFWDKVGNVLLVLLAILPIAILGFIFWWFIGG